MVESIVFRLVLLCLVISNAGANPVLNGTGACSHRALACDQETAVIRCLSNSEICDGAANCHSGQDEIDCDGDLYSPNNHLVSSRDLNEDLVISNLTSEACGKFCREEDRFECIGFQHHFSSNMCRLLDAEFSKRTLKPVVRGFWITFLLAGNSLSKLAVIEESSPLFDGPTMSEGVTDDNLESIIVEADFSSAFMKRKRRQIVNTISNQPAQSRKHSFRSEFLAKSEHANCGSRSVDFDPPKREGRIVGGVIPPDGAYPWQAAIARRDGQSLIHQCGAVIISRYHVLTAAHCIYRLRPREFVVVIGNYNRDSRSPDEQVFDVDQRFIHERFSSAKEGNDIALVKLKSINGEGIVFGSKVEPICLPHKDSVYKQDTWCAVSGWGKESEGSTSSSILRVAAVPLISPETCSDRQVYGNKVPADFFKTGMLCAGFLAGGVDACLGDSGGPLACNVDGKFQLLGLVSGGEGCAGKNKPGIYVKVGHYFEWIKEHSRK